MPNPGVYRHPPPPQQRPSRLLPKDAGTRFYLQPFPPREVDRPTAGEKSTALPVGTLNDVAGSDQILSTTIGQVETSLPFFATLPQTTHQDGYLARFVTETSLAAQTIAANTWTFAFQASEGTASANAFLALSLYVWRPGTASVVGYIYDSDTALGTEWTTTRSALIVSFSGASVAVNNGDVLVLEVWEHAIQGLAASFTPTVYYGGTADVQPQSVEDAASYLETPQVLSLAAIIADIGDTLYLHSAAAAVFPTADEKSLALPVGTLTVSASGTADEQRSMSLIAGSSQVAFSYNSLAQTDRQDGYLLRFSSTALAAQTIAAGTWTIGIAALEGAVQANAFLGIAVYAYRPSTTTVVGRIIDTSAAWGNEWATAETGRVISNINGNAVTVLASDILVLELWSIATQQTAAAQANQVFYDGTTAPLAGVAASSAASYLRAPVAITFVSGAVAHRLMLMGCGH